VDMVDGTESGRRGDDHQTRTCTSRVALETLDARAGPFSTQMIHIANSEELRTLTVSQIALTAYRPGQKLTMAVQLGRLRFPTEHNQNIVIRIIAHGRCRRSASRRIQHIGTAVHMANLSWSRRKEF